MTFYNNKYLFIHIEKNGGSYITHHLSKKLNCHNTKSFFYRGKFKGKGGVKISEFEQVYGRNFFQDKFIFCFKRNPYTRMLSWYKYIHKKNLKEIENKRESYLNWLFKIAEYPYDQYLYLTFQNGELCKNVNIYSFENFNTSMKSLCSNLKININLTKKKLNNSINTFDKHIESPESNSFISKRFSKDFEIFDYKKY